jgi:NDP-sugar pyrophosphorylase family protein
VLRLGLGHALVHESSLLHTGVNLFGPVLIGPDCEIGPNASIFGPTVIEGRSYLGPSVEIRRCLLLARAEVSHITVMPGRRITETPATLPNSLIMKNC